MGNCDETRGVLVPNTPVDFSGFIPKFPFLFSWARSVRPLPGRSSLEAAAEPMGAGLSGLRSDWAARVVQSCILLINLMKLGCVAN